MFAATRAESEPARKTRPKNIVNARKATKMRRPTTNIFKKIPKCPSLSPVAIPAAIRYDRKNKPTIEKKITEYAQFKASSCQPVYWSNSDLFSFPSFRNLPISQANCLLLSNDKFLTGTLYLLPAESRRIALFANGSKDSNSAVKVPSSRFFQTFRSAPEAEFGATKKEKTNVRKKKQEYQYLK